MHRILVFLAAIGALSGTIAAPVPSWAKPHAAPSMNINVNDLMIKHDHALYKKVHDEYVVAAHAKVFAPLAEKLHTLEVSAECKAAALKFTSDTVPSCSNAFNFGNSMSSADREAALCGDNKCLSQVEAFFNVCKSEVADVDVTGSFKTFAILLRGFKSLCPAAAGESGCFESAANYQKTMSALDFDNGAPSKSQMDAVCGDPCINKIHKFFLSLVQSFDPSTAAQSASLFEALEAICFKDSNGDYCYAPMVSELSSGNIVPSKICPNACYRKVFIHLSNLMKTTKKDMGTFFRVLCAKNGSTYCLDAFSNLGDNRQQSDPCDALSASTPSCPAECKTRVQTVVDKIGCCVATYGEILTKLDKPTGMMAGLAEAGKMFTTANRLCEMGLKFDGSDSCKGKGKLKGKVALKGITKAMIDKARDKYVKAFKSDLSTSTGVPEDNITVTSIEEITTRRMRAIGVLGTAVAFNYEIETTDAEAAAAVEKAISEEVSEGTLELPTLEAEIAETDPSISADVEPSASKVTNETPPSSSPASSPSNSASSVALGFASVVFGLVAALF